jgi:stage II sporulation protein D
LRAQAIAARTYAWYEKQTMGHSRNWDVKATESSQMYIGTSREGKAVEAESAVHDTQGLVCTWDSPEGERIFCTYYSSTCGGSTQNAAPVKNVPAIPPLMGGVACEFCRESPHYRWDPIRITKKRITQRLGDKYPKFKALGPIESMEVVECTPTGRPVRFSFKGESGRSLELEAENFRLAYDSNGREIPSTFFEPVVTPDAVVLENGRGWGHGLGLCQYGADGLAHTGQHAADILKFYYPGSHLTRAY